MEFAYFINYGMRTKRIKTEEYEHMLMPDLSDRYIVHCLYSPLSNSNIKYNLMKLNEKRPEICIMHVWTTAVRFFFLFFSIYTFGYPD